MGFYIYVEREDEIFIDLDGGSARALEMTGQRTMGGIRSGRLPALAVHLFPSRGKDHYHLAVELKQSMNPLERLAWSLYLGGDRKHVARNLWRQAYFSSSPTILSSPARWPDYREPDGVCGCSRKHAGEGLKRCPVAQQLGIITSEPFGPPLDETVRWDTLGCVWDWTEGAGPEDLAHGK